MSTTFLTVACAFLIYLPLHLVVRLKSKRGRPPLPPGPPTWPIIGNLLDFPMKGLWLSGAEWEKTYGDLCHLNVVGKNILFINSAEAAFDLLDKRGAIYSDRPETVMAGELCGLNRLLPFISYTPTFRRQRALMQRALGSRQIPLYHTLIHTQTQAFIERLVRNPHGYMKHIRAYAGGLVLGVVYGYRVGHDGGVKTNGSERKNTIATSNPNLNSTATSVAEEIGEEEEDVYLKLAAECLSTIANRITAFGVWVVDVVPVLRHVPEWMFPGGWFKREGREFKAKYEGFVEGPWGWAKERARDEVKRRKNGGASGAGDEVEEQIHSFCDLFLKDDNQLTEEMEHDVKWTANSMYAASADTTIATMAHFILAMVQNPSVLAKAQQELDEVLGRDRMPTFEDREALPYLQCIFLEAIRWSAPTPVGIAHSLREDDVYRDMWIPKGTVVLANIWAMLRNEDLYPDPHTFNPDRFLVPLDSELEKKRDPRTYAFGFGRRRCPAGDLVDASIWLAIVSIVSALDVSAEMGQDGEPCMPEVVYEDAFFRTPSLFKFNVGYRGGYTGRR